LLDLRKKRLFLFDLDGVFLKGKEQPVLIGGRRILRKLREGRKRVFLLTNNSTDTVQAVYARLKAAGLPFRREEILTSTRLTAEYVAKNYPDGRYYLVGEAGLDQELRRLRLRRTFGTHADVVVVGLDRKLTYRKLDTAVKVAKNGADIVGTHPARLYMYKHGPAVAVGPILRAIEYGSGKKGIAIGKPSSVMFELALAKSRCAKREAIMIGDQEDTDIIGASRAGIDSILVLTGFDNPKRTRALAKISNVDDLVEFL
jgi:4-nitrophenyl phosphatase